MVWSVQIQSGQGNCLSRRFSNTHVAVKQNVLPFCPHGHCRTWSCNCGVPQPLRCMRRRGVLKDDRFAACAAHCLRTEVVKNKFFTPLLALVSAFSFQLQAAGRPLVLVSRIGFALLQAMNASVSRNVAGIVLMDRETSSIPGKGARTHTQTVTLLHHILLPRQSRHFQIYLLSLALRRASRRARGPHLDKARLLPIGGFGCAAAWPFVSGRRFWSNLTFRVGGLLCFA